MIRIHIKKKVIRDGLYVDYKSQLLVCCCYWRGNMDDRVNALLLETALYRSFHACREILFQIKNVLYTEFRISHVSYNIDNEERNVKKKKKEKLDFKKTPCWEKESKQFSIQEWQKCNLAVVPSIMRKWKCVVDTYIYVYRVFHLKSSLKLFIFFLKNVSNENYFIY